MYLCFYCVLKGCETRWRPIRFSLSRLGESRLQEKVDSKLIKEFVDEKKHKGYITFSYYRIFYKLVLKKKKPRALYSP